MRAIVEREKGMSRLQQISSTRHAVIIGSGVSGLTTALELNGRGMRVTVIAEKFAPDIVSVVAGALWEWPPAVCGYHSDQGSLERSKEWCMVSFYKFEEMLARSIPGVHVRPVNFYFTEPIESNPDDLGKMREIEANVPGFHRLSRADLDEVNPQYGVVDGYRHPAPMVDTDAYMRWLMAEVRRVGITVEQRRIVGPLREQRSALLAEYDADALVCCAGLGTAELNAADMYPLRGALVRMKNDGTRFPRINEAHCVSHRQGSNKQDIVFIVPRGEDMLVLGGLTEPHEWSTDLSLDYAPVREMYERCIAFMPALAAGELDGVEPVRTGLRPFRIGNVCVEYDQDDDVFYNYGHGGSGVTLSWGCAAHVADTLEELGDRTRRSAA
jgi:D-amino-acid oxidase